MRASYCRAILDVALTLAVAVALALAVEGGGGGGGLREGLVVGGRA